MDNTEIMLLLSMIMSKKNLHWWYILWIFLKPKQYLKFKAPPSKRLQRIKPHRNKSQHTG